MRDTTPQTDSAVSAGAAAVSGQSNLLPLLGDRSGVRSDALDGKVGVTLRAPLTLMFAQPTVLATTAEHKPENDRQPEETQHEVSSQSKKPGCCIMS